MSGLEGSEKKDCFSKHLLHRISTIDATLATHARTISARAEERIGRNIGEWSGNVLSYRKITSILNVALRTAHNINHLFRTTVPKKIPQPNELRILSHSDELFIIGVNIESHGYYFE